MKEFASKQQQISAARVAELLPNEALDYGSKSGRRPFRGGLHAVAPLEVTPEPQDGEAGSEADIHQAALEADRANNGRNQLIRSVFSPKITLKRAISPQRPLPMLTTDEFIQVRLSTVRESTRHCYWPSDVLARFLSADVITNNGGQ